MGKWIAPTISFLMPALYLGTYFIPSISVIFLPLTAIGILALGAAWYALLTTKNRDPFELAIGMGNAVSAFVLVLCGYAEAYASLGVVNSKDGAILHDHADGLYFSIITFTTTGYGDVVPLPKLRLLAASEAVIGFVMMAALIAFFARILKNIFEAEIQQAP